MPGGQAKHVSTELKKAVEELTVSAICRSGMTADSQPAGQLDASCRLCRTSLFLLCRIPLAVKTIVDMAKKRMYRMFGYGDG